MNLRRFSGLVCLACLLAIPGTALTLPWDKDMRNQPSVKPQESQVSTNHSTVPVGGRDRYPPPKDIIELVRARLEAGRTLANPKPKSPESLARGREMYERHCLVCHGAQGRGNGPARPSGSCVGPSMAMWTVPSYSACSRIASPVS